MEEENSKKKLICAFYSEIPYINKDPVPGFKNCFVESVQGRCSVSKKDCSCIGNEKLCENKKKNKNEK